MFHKAVRPALLLSRIQPSPEFAVITSHRTSWCCWLLSGNQESLLDVFVSQVGRLRSCLMTVPFLDIDASLAWNRIMIW